MWSCREKMICLMDASDVIEVITNGPPKATTSTATSYSHTEVWSRDCHKGLHVLGKIGGCTVWIGKESEVTFKVPLDVDKAWDLVVCLIKGTWSKIAGGAGDRILACNESAEETFGSLVWKTPTVPYMHINWPDYGIPSQLPMEWWRVFVDKIASLEEGSNIVMFCMGGHGRTGTAASIVASVGGLVPDDMCPVTWLRSFYCKEAVECHDQLKYVEDMTGRKVSAGGSKNTYGGYTNTRYAKTEKPVKEGRTGWWQRTKEGSFVKHYFNGGRKVTSTKSDECPDLQPGEAELLEELDGHPFYVEDSKGTPILSNNKYKAYAKAMGLFGSNEFPHIGMLKDMTLVTVEGYVFGWDDADNRFYFYDMAVNLEDEASTETPPEADSAGK